MADLKNINNELYVSAKDTDGKEKLIVVDGKYIQLNKDAFKGDKGDQGKQGEKGDKGEKGDSPDFDKVKTQIAEVETKTQDNYKELKSHERRVGILEKETSVDAKQIQDLKTNVKNRVKQLTESVDFTTTTELSNLLEGDDAVNLIFQADFADQHPKFFDGNVVALGPNLIEFTNRFGDALKFENDVWEYIKASSSDEDLIFTQGSGNSRHFKSKVNTSLLLASNNNNDLVAIGVDGGEPKMIFSKPDGSTRDVLLKNLPREDNASSEKLIFENGNQSAIYEFKNGAGQNIQLSFENGEPRIKWQGDSGAGDFSLKNLTLPELAFDNWDSESKTVETQSLKSSIIAENSANDKIGLSIDNGVAKITSSIAGDVKEVDVNNIVDPDKQFTDGSGAHREFKSGVEDTYIQATDKNNEYIRIRVENGVPRLEWGVNGFEYNIPAFQISGPDKSFTNGDLGAGTRTLIGFEDEAKIVIKHNNSNSQLSAYANNSGGFIELFKGGITYTVDIEKLSENLLGFNSGDEKFRMQQTTEDIYSIGIHQTVNNSKFAIAMVLDNPYFAIQKNGGLTELIGISDLAQKHEDNRFGKYVKTTYNNGLIDDYRAEIKYCFDNDLPIIYKSEGQHYHRVVMFNNLYGRTWIIDNDGVSTNIKGVDLSADPARKLILYNERPTTFKKNIPDPFAPTKKTKAKKMVKKAEARKVVKNVN